MISCFFTTCLRLCPSLPDRPRASLKGRRSLPSMLLPLSGLRRDCGQHEWPVMGSTACCLSQSQVNQGTVICENINKYKSLSRGLQYIILPLNNNRPYYLSGRSSCQGNQGWTLLMKTNDLLQKSGEP